MQTFKGLGEEGLGGWVGGGGGGAWITLLRPQYQDKTQCVSRRGFSSSCRELYVHRNRKAY